MAAQIDYLTSWLSDHLKAYLTIFLEADDLIVLSQCSKVWYIFSNEAPLWMIQVLRKHGGDFTYHHSWKSVYFQPKPMGFIDRPIPSISVPTAIFSSDFLYRRYCRCHMDLTYFVPEQNTSLIPRILCEDLSLQKYQSKYALRPFIMTNSTTNWPAYVPGPNEWMIDSLVGRFGDVKCRVTHNLDVQSAMQMTLRDFSTYAKYQQDETPLYIFDQHFGESMPELLDDYKIPEIFNEDLLAVIPVSQKRPDYRWLVVGPPRSGASWHVDPAKTSAWNTLLVGRKRWVLYPPGKTPPGITLLDDDTASPGCSTLDWFLHVYPTLSEEEKPFEIVQEAGDLIYVPSGWWHAVLNLDFTIAVTQNFVDSHNLSAFIQDLMYDHEYDRLEQLQGLLSRVAPSMTYLFELNRMPLDEGFLHESAMVHGLFSNISTWSPRMSEVIQSHPPFKQALQDHITRDPWHTPIHALTSRVNPTFSLHGGWVIKFFSSLNRLWGECKESVVLSTMFPNKNLSSRKSISLQRYLEEPFEMERIVYSLLSSINLSPQLVASGYLTKKNEGPWRWPYAITSYDPSLITLQNAVKRGQGLERCSWVSTVEWLKTVWFPAFHGLLVPSREGILGNDMSTMSWYIGYLQRLRDSAFAVHASNGIIPMHLMQQLDDFLPENVESLVNAQTKVSFLHQDLTDENILGIFHDSIDVHLASIAANDREKLLNYCLSNKIPSIHSLIQVEPWEATGVGYDIRWQLMKIAQAEVVRATSNLLDGEFTEISTPDIVYDGSARWSPHMVIDFADTKSGDPLWDLIAVFFSMLHGDQSLCKLLLDCSYWAKQIEGIPFEQRLMALTLLHPSQCVAAMFHYFPDIKTMATWTDIAHAVFGPMNPFKIPTSSTSTP